MRSVETARLRLPSSTNLSAHTLLSKVSFPSQLAIVPDQDDQQIHDAGSQCNTLVVLCEKPLVRVKPEISKFKMVSLVSVIVHLQNNSELFRTLSGLLRGVNNYNGKAARSARRDLVGLGANDTQQGRGYAQLFFLVLRPAFDELCGPAIPQCKVNFNSTSSVAVGSSPDGLAAADLNRDGRLDLAVVNKGSNNVSILLNQGGSFAVTVTYSVGSAPNAIAAADYNKDGKIDMAVTNGSSNTFTLIRGMGNGEFLVGFTFNTQAAPSSLTFADLNLDGNQDIAVVHLDGQAILIFFGDGTGTFVNSTNISLAGFTIFYKTSIIAADLNLDGKPDIVAAGMLTGQGYTLGDHSAAALIALGNGAGGFGAVTYFGSLFKFWRSI